MNGVSINIYFNKEDIDYFENELVNSRKLPVACTIIDDTTAKIQMNVAALNMDFLVTEIIAFNNGDYEDIMINNDRYSHISIVASN